MPAMSLAYLAVVCLVDRLLHERLVFCIWDRDLRAWGAAPGSADERSIQTRFGWLDVAKTMVLAILRTVQLAQQLSTERFDAVYLLGMGGSSFCAEVLCAVCGIAPGHSELYIFDTTDEQTIASAAARLDPVCTLFFKRYEKRFKNSEGKRIFLEFTDKKQTHLDLLIRKYRLLIERQRVLLERKKKKTQRPAQAEDPTTRQRLTHHK